MKISRTILALSAASLFAASVAQGAIISTTFNVTNAVLPSLYSGTLDAPCTPFGGTPGTPGAGFFFCAAASIAPVVIAITPSAGGAGTISLKYDDATGQVTEITSLDFYVSNMLIKITAGVSGDVTVVSGNSVPAVNDFPFLKAGTAGTNGSADADQNPGSITSFQYDAPGTEVDATQFATFTNIVDTCVGTACALIPVLNINGLRYEIVGTVSGTGAGRTYNGTLRSETSNNSNYFVNFTSAVVPAPAAGWLLLTAVGGLAARRLKKRAA
jgi:hypothetical protein